MGRCVGLYADVQSSNLGASKFFLFFFEKNLVFFALGLRGFESRV